MIFVSGTMPPRRVSSETAGKDAREAVRDFLALHPGARVEKVNDRHVVAVCDCGMPVLENDPVACDRGNGGYACATCAAAQRDAEMSAA